MLGALPQGLLDVGVQWRELVGGFRKSSEAAHGRGSGRRNSWGAVR